MAISSIDHQYYILFNQTLMIKSSLLCLEPLFINKSIRKIYLNAKNTFKILLQYNINSCDNFFDITIVDYLINPENNRSFTNIVQRHNIDAINLDLLDLNIERDTICYLIEMARMLIVINKTQETSLPENTPKIQKLAARSVHFGMYISLSGTAITGLLIGRIFLL